MTMLRTTLLLTMTLALAPFDAPAASKAGADGEVARPCVDAERAGRLEAQLSPLALQTDALLRALVEDKQTPTSPDAMYVLGRNVMLLERSRHVEHTPDVLCPVRIDRLSRDTRMIALVFAALLDGNPDYGIAKLDNKAAREALPQLLAQAKAIEESVAKIAVAATL
jgi:hypothetical protein